MTGSSLAGDELAARLRAIEDLVTRNHGVGEAEDLLVDLLRFLEEGRVNRQHAEQVLLEFIAAWPPRAGAVEAVEFTMRTLRWESLSRGLEQLVASDADFRVRDLAKRALRAYEPEWIEGQAYRTYRSG